MVYQTELKQFGFVWLILPDRFNVESILNEEYCQHQNSNKNAFPYPFT